MASGSKSIAWTLFTVDVEDSKKAVCNVCDQKISRGNKIGYLTTTNMLKHLETKHSKELEIEKIKRKDNEEKEKRRQATLFPSTSKVRRIEKVSSKQMTLQETLDSSKPWNIHDNKAKKIHQYIGEMIAADLQPFSVVEDIGFIRLIKAICPYYEMPSRKFIKETVVQEIYEKVLKKIQQDIASSPYISFTSDCWTASSSNSSFISLTAHWIDDKYQLKSAILQVSPFDVKHTAHNISENINGTLDKFNLSKEKVHVIVRDNATNMAAGINQANIESLPCFAHTLQLILNDAIFEQRYVKDIIAVCRQIVGHFNHSPPAFAKYEQYQKQFNVPTHRFIQDIQTRWNSSYLMIQRILEQKPAIISYCSDHPKPNSLENNQWKILEKLQIILKNFYDCTNFMSSREALASLIIPNIKVISTFFESAESKGLFSGLGSTLAVWKSSVKHRLESYINDKNLILATFLDPRFKDNFLEIQYETKPVHEAIVSWLSEDLLNVPKPDDETAMLVDSSESANSDNDQNTDFNFSFEKCLSDLKKKNTHKKCASKNQEENLSKTSMHLQSVEITTEMKKYCSLKLINNSENPLKWWNAHKEDLPKLARLVRKYLCSPPTSVESERLFSVGGNIYTPKRNRLEPTTGEMLMFLHYNLRILKFNYE